MFRRIRNWQHECHGSLSVESATSRQQRLSAMKLLGTVHSSVISNTDNSPHPWACWLGQRMGDTHSHQRPGPLQPPPPPKPKLGTCPTLPADEENRSACVHFVALCIMCLFHVCASNNRTNWDSYLNREVTRD